MKSTCYLFLFIVINIVTGKQIIIRQRKIKNYAPTWEDLSTRPIPSWYDEAKIGIFIHWGVYSVPSYGNSSEWFWAHWKSNSTCERNYMEKNYSPRFEYQDFAKDFTTDLFRPHKWAQLFEKSGAKYVVFTSKHHDGFTMFPSKYSFNWNSVDVGPHRDIIGELSTAIRNLTDLKFGLYYSLFEFFHPLYLSDKEFNFTCNQFPTMKMIPEMQDMVWTYKPEIFWADGDWEASAEYFQSKEFLAWLYNDSPVRDTVVANDRWGQQCPCHNGDFFTCADRFNPGVLQKHKWESTVTLDKYSWGYRRATEIDEYLTIETLISLLVRAISCRGNFLINVGPTKDGIIPPIMQERLLQVGEWLSHNGEAIYKSHPWVYQNETDVPVWYTSKNNAVYAIFLKWPRDNIIRLERVLYLFQEKTVSVIHLLTSTKLAWMYSDENTAVDVILPDKATVIVKWAWVLKIHN